jgi:hypothetical protein
MPLGKQYALCGLLNSLVVNFLVRLRVSTHVSTSIVERLPVPVGEDAPAAARTVAAIARLLARKTETSAFARLNAIVARLYRLSTAEYEHIVESFPLLPSDLRQLCVAEYAKDVRFSA